MGGRVLWTALAALLAAGSAAAETLPLTPPAPLLAADTETRAAAIECLAAAITYEAGHEPVAGQEAVAQVVLNRVRHPAFPKTVCGVVYQGSTRRTGCQFTFTCDGSLLRRRAPAALLAARAVAMRVLDRGSAGVGEATFYHADYVSPYWAPALVRVAQIGAHIFYRFPGGGLSTEVARAIGGAPGQPAIPNSTSFAVWGLTAATIARHGDRLDVRGN